MYDSVNFKLRNFEARGIDFINETSCYFNVTGEHSFNGELVVSGNLDGLKVTASRGGVNIKDGSLCKWYLGDNIKTMGRGDTQRAIEKLSDTLHLPMNKADITRIDIAQNFIVKHPPEVYINHLGTLKNSKRLAEPEGLYYCTRGGRLCFYDKIKEAKHNSTDIPELYRDRNVLRYEQRYISRIASTLKRNEIKANMLYDEAFYIELLNNWYNSYLSIQKINDVTLNLSVMKTKQELYKMGVLALINQAGGQLQMLEQIKEAQQKGDLSKKQAFDLKQAVNDAMKLKNDVVKKNEAITELDKQMKQAIKFYI